MKNYLLIFGLLCGLMACKKNVEPITYVTEPIYMLEGQINGAPKKIAAGIDQFYLYTNYGYDSLNQVQQFYATLKKDCPNCKEQFYFQLRDYQTAGIYHSDSSFALGKYDYSLSGEPNIPAYQIKLEANPSGIGAILNQSWLINGTTISDSNIVNRTYKPGEPVNIQYNCNYTGCSAVLSYQLKLLPHMKASELPQMQMSALDSSYQIYKFEATSGMPNATFYWMMGDGKKLNGNIVYYGYKDSGNQLISLYQISGNDTLELKQWLNVGETNTCTANFINTITPIIEPMNYSTMLIIYTDPNGQIFTSDEMPQDFNSYFKIIGQSEGPQNNFQQANRNLAIQFQAKLKGVGGILQFKDWKGKMAMGHP